MSIPSCNHFRGPSGNKGSKRKKNLRVKVKHKSKYPNKFKEEIKEVLFISLSKQKDGDTK